MIAHRLVTVVLALPEFWKTSVFQAVVRSGDVVDQPELFLLHRASVVEVRQGSEAAVAFP